MALISAGISQEIFPPLIFLGVGAMTDFGPLIANPKTLLLGAAAQIGVFVALGGAMMLGFTAQEAAAIGIIGGADGPTSIYLATKLAPHLLGAIAVAAYSYMSLVPLIQPPVMKLLQLRKKNVKLLWSNCVMLHVLKKSYSQSLQQSSFPYCFLPLHPLLGMLM